MVFYTQQTLVQVTSDQVSNRAFGTGFVIHQDGTSAYFLTCAHVLRDVGGRDHVKAGGRSATVVAEGESDGIDIAVVMVDQLADISPLTLNPAGFTGTNITCKLS